MGDSLCLYGPSWPARPYYSFPFQPPRHFRFLYDRESRFPPPSALCRVQRGRRGSLRGVAVATPGGDEHGGAWKGRQVGEAGLAGPEQQPLRGFPSKWGRVLPWRRQLGCLLLQWESCDVRSWLPIMLDQKLQMSFKYWLLFLLYFVQGIPYGLQSGLLPIYFRTVGLSFTKISLTKLFYLPWFLKVLWAPFVDWYFSKKAWLIFTMGGLALICLACSFLTPEVDFLGLAVALLLMNFFTSIQDVATDGIAIQLLGPGEVGFGNSVQVVAYKLGSVLAGGGLLTFLHHLGWGALFVYLALIYAAAIGFTSRFHLRPSSPDSQAKESNLNLPGFFHELLLVPDTLWLAGLLLIYKLGEQGSVSMFPLFLLDHSFSPQKLGFWNGIVATTFSILGSSLGGHLMSDSRNCKSLRTLLVLRFCNLLFQTWVMVTYADQETAFEVAAVLSMCIQHFIGGLITTLVFSKMMLCTQKAPESIQATHYSLLAAIEVLGKLAFSTVSGSLVDRLGFPHAFGVFLALSFASILYTV